MTAGYCLTVVGSYRVFFGNGRQGRSTLASLGRIVYGLAVTIGFCVAATIAARVGRI